MDEKRLLKYAIDYLSRYDSSKQNLINVLKRKVFRLKISGIEKAKLNNNLEKIVFKIQKYDLINDERYSLSKISNLSQAGKSKRYIYDYLIKKGVDKLNIQEKIKAFENQNKDWELESAKLYVRKKKLLDSNMSYEKKLSKMARAGFNYDICKKVLG